MKSGEQWLSLDDHQAHGAIRSSGTQGRPSPRSLPPLEDYASETGLILSKALPVITIAGKVYFILRWIAKFSHMKLLWWVDLFHWHSTASARKIPLSEFTK